MLPPSALIVFPIAIMPSIIVELRMSVKFGIHCEMGIVGEEQCFACDKRVGMSLVNGESVVRGVVSLQGGAALSSTY